MDRVPFIVEFWDSRKNSFIGVMKFSLGKIKQGFVVNNSYVNEWAVKANVMPTVVVQGEVKVEDLKGVAVGVGWARMMVGTGGQVGRWISEERESEEKERQRELKEIRDKPVQVVQVVQPVQPQVIQPVQAPQQAQLVQPVLPAQAPQQPVQTAPAPQPLALPTVPTPKPSELA